MVGESGRPRSFRNNGVPSTTDSYVLGKIKLQCNLGLRILVPVWMSRRSRGSFLIYRVLISVYGRLQG